MSKIETIEAIKTYFAKQGKRMTNLNKLPIEKLQEIVNKYNIDLEEFSANRKEQQKQQREIMKQKKEKQQEEERRREEERQQEIKKRNDMLKQIKIKMPFTMKSIQMKWACNLQLYDYVFIKNNPEEIKRVKELQADIMESTMKQMMRNNHKAKISIISDDTILCDGMKIIIGTSGLVDITTEMKTDKQYEYLTQSPYDWDTILLKLDELNYFTPVVEPIVEPIVEEEVELHFKPKRIIRTRKNE
jgi:hypothetical protein